MRAAYLRAVQVYCARLSKSPLLQAVHNELRAAKQDLVTREQQFERELSTAQTLSGMYKESLDARAHKVSQLEGVISELRTHNEVCFS